MTDGPVRVAFHLDQSPALVGVLRSAIHFQACHAGLDPEKGTDFAKASEDVCREALSHLNDADAGLEVTLDTYPDRIEITIHHHGQPIPAVGLETFAFSEGTGERDGSFNGLELLTRVDRVLFNSEDGVARTTLVKFLNPSDKSSSPDR